MYDYSKWLSHLGHPRLLVVGDLMLDRYVWGEAERVSPHTTVVVSIVENNTEGRILKNLLGVISGEITPRSQSFQGAWPTKRRFFRREFFELQVV